ncbi:hypothetical protein Tco_0542667 [Tanacetum coccineum]
MLSTKPPNMVTFPSSFVSITHHGSTSFSLPDMLFPSSVIRSCNVVPDEEEVAIDAIPLATKPPSIVDWKIVKEGKISLFQIIRANGSSKSAVKHNLVLLLQLLSDYYCWKDYADRDEIKD